MMSERPSSDLFPWSDWVTLTKPRIVMSNLITAWAGFFLATRKYSEWYWGDLIWMSIGAALVMASGCVFNNYLDREMDQRMARTKNRALPMFRIKPISVFIYGSVLGILGLLALFLVNPLTGWLGVIGWVSYVWLYTYWLKRTSTLSTVWGGIAGSVPPVIGYCAVSNNWDIGASLLFAFLFLWQPPHFLALAIRRKEEYRAAGFPLLPVEHGVETTKLQMLRYAAALPMTTILFYVAGLAGTIYLVISTVLGLIWLWGIYQGFSVNADQEEAWAKRWFFYSIWYLTIVSILLMFA